MSLRVVWLFALVSLLLSACQWVHEQPDWTVYCDTAMRDGEFICIHSWQMHPF